MADNVAITAGTGTSIATDDVSGVHYQRVKLATGVLESSTPIGHAEDDGHSSGDGGIMALTVRKDSAAATSGADGDYQPAITDATGRMWVRPAPVVTRIQVTPTITAGAYASGDVVGGSSVPLEFANAARVSGGSGMVMAITLLDKTQAQRAAFDLVFFDRSVTVPADNAIFGSGTDPTDANMANCLGVVSIGPYNTAWAGTPLHSISTLPNVGLPFVVNGTSLWVVMVVRGTPTYTSTSDLVLTLTILQD